MKKAIFDKKPVFICALLGLIFAVSVYAEKEVDYTDDKQNKEVLTELEKRMMKPVSVDFRDTPVEDVIRIMALQANVDIVKSPKVTGSVTATLTDIPLGEALNNILAVHDFGYVADKNMIRVMPRAEIFDAREKLINRIYRITYADVKQVEKTLLGFISKQGSLSSSPGTSNIIVTDAESKIKAIDAFIEEIDRMTPQIMVEARIYDITSKDRFDLGVEWQAGENTTYADGITGVGTNPTAQRGDTFGTGIFSGTVSKSENTTAGLRLGWLNSSMDIDLMIRAQKENIDAKLLANPRVLVLDNERAQIKIITEIPYQEVTETSGGGSIGSTSFRDVGVTLDVVPHVARDGMIRLQLAPTFSVRTGNVDVANSLSQPVVDKREAFTTLLVKNNDTVVLGGLRKKEVTQQLNKVPLLGDIPLLGGMFRFEGEDNVVSELVVFITPRIVEQHVLSELEKQQLDVTDFAGPQLRWTEMEKDIEDDVDVSLYPDEVDYSVQNEDEPDKK